MTPPGIYGTSYELQIDVSRVPRYEEYAVLDADAQSGMTRLLSDVKTVSYYVVDSRSIPGNPTVGNLPINTGSGGGGQRGRSNNSYGINGSLGLPPDTLLSGLARRVNDRAAWRYAVDRGEDTETNQQAELIAPEVAYVEFSYYDGSQWVSEWDTQQMGGVPMAVEINLFLGTQEQANSQALNAGRRRTADADATNVSPSISYDPDHWYRLVVNLPSADADALTSASSDSSSSTSGSTTNSTSTGGTQ